jgi:hypothetical protein
MAMQQPDQPGQRVRGRCPLRAKQHGRDVAGDVTVVDTRIAGICRRQHRLEQIAGVLVQGRICLHPITRCRDETLDGLAHRGVAALELSIGGQSDPAPIRQRRHRASVQSAEHDVEMALDHVVARLERVDLGAEGQARDRVDSRSASGRPAGRSTRQPVRPCATAPAADS